MLFNHQRPDGNSKDQILPIGYWVDIEVDDDQITAIPFFDDEDEFAMSIYSKVENNVLRMCSAGAEPLATSSDSSLLVPGQSRETVTKWVLKEASICDIGANPNSLSFVELYVNNTSIKLSSGHENPIPKLNKTEMAKKKIKLSDQEKDDLIAQLQSKLQELDPDGDKDPVELSEEEKDVMLSQLQEEIENLKQQLQDAQESLKLAEEEKENEKVENLVNKAVTLKQITAIQKPHFIKLAKNDFESTKNLLETMRPHKSLQNSLASSTSTADDSRVVELSKQSYDELFLSGDLTYLKLHAPDIYKEKHINKFGKEPQNI